MSSPFVSEGEGNEEVENNDYDIELVKEFELRKQELVTLRSKLQKRLSVANTTYFSWQDYQLVISSLEKHARIPSFDFDKRLEYIKMFCPDMQIESISREDNELSFLLNFPKLFQFQVHLWFNEESTVNDLKILHISGVCPELDLVDALVKSTSELKDISMFISTMNAYVKLYKLRSNTWTELLHDFILIKELNHINDYQLDRFKGDDLNLLAYMLFKNKSFIELEFPEKTLVINWSIQFDTVNNNMVSSDAISRFQANLIINKNKRDDSSIISHNLTSLFNGLIKSDGIRIATNRILQNI